MLGDLSPPITLYILMDIKSKAKNAIPYAVGISIVNVLVALFGMVLLVRYLEAYEYGVYAILNALPIVINRLSALGYDQYLSRYIPGMEDRYEISYIVWNIIFKRVLLICLISFIMIVSFDMYADKFGLAGYYLHFLYYQIIVIFFTANELLRRALLARFSQKVILITNVIVESFRVGVIVFGVNQQLELIFYVQGFLIAECLSFVMLAFQFNKLYKMQRWLNMLKSRKENKEEKNYRWGTYIDKLGASFLSTDIDRYILAYISTNVQVAIYAISTKILTKILNFYPDRMFQHVIAPTLYNTYDNSQLTSDLNRMFKFVYGANNIIGILFLSVFVPFGVDLLLLVFHQDYITQAYWPLTFFLIFLIFNNVPLTFIAQAIKKPKILVISKLAFVFNLSIGIPAAYYYGAMGMAIATASSGALKNVIIYLLINKHVRLLIPWKSTVKSLVNGSITIILSILLEENLEGFLLLKVAFGIIIYGILLKINPVFDNKENKLFISLIPKKLQKLASVFI